MPDLINLSHADVEAEYNLEGYGAYDSDGHKVGSIDSVIADANTMEIRYLVVDSGGLFSHKQFVVPAGDVKQIDDDRRRVSFRSLTRQKLQSGAFPTYDASWWDRNERASFKSYERGVARAYRPDHPPEEAIDYSSDLYRRPAEGAQRLQLLEERLRVSKEAHQAGAVRLGKRITEHTETVHVPVREERVIIERQPGSGQVPADTELGVGETIEVPLTRERVVINKEPVVVEEIAVRKEAIEREEQVQETVRREELAVEDPTGRVVRNREGAPERGQDRPARPDEQDTLRQPR